MTSIEVSAQFGGGDAADALMPHFDALKMAAQDITFEGLPFSRLAFVLRVDGQVRAFGQCGAGRIDVDQEGDSVSVDIGIPKEEWSELGSRLSAFIANALAASPAVLQQLKHPRLEGVDWAPLVAAVGAFSEAYLRVKYAAADIVKEPSP